MKKLRKISLDGLDYLSSDERKKLLGGDSYNTITFKTTAPPKPLPCTGTADDGKFELGITFRI